MSLLGSMKVSSSALTAERMRMDLIADNISNAGTTRTPQGGAYRRKLAVLEAMADGGVRVANVAQDPAPLKEIHDPSHPHADARGMVQMPNVEVVKEMVDLITASRSYEANITAFNAAKGMAMRALDIGRAG